MKKIFYVLSIVLIVGGITFGVAVIFEQWQGNEDEIDLSRNALIHRPASSETDGNSTATPLKISKESALGYYRNSGTDSVRYYSPESGNIYEATLSAKPESKTVAKIKIGASEVTWSRTGDKVIAKYHDGLYFYDIKAGTSQKLNEKIKNPVFSPHSDDVVYLFFDVDTGEGSLSVARDDFSSYKNIMQTRFQNWHIDWIDKENLSLMTRPSSNGLNTLLSFNIPSGKLAPLVEDKKGLSALWSPDGKSILLSSVIGSSYQLLSLRPGQSTAKGIPLKTTTSKCAWGSDSIVYCSDGRGVHRIQISDDEISTIEVSQIKNAQNITVSRDQKTIVYRDGETGMLYSTQLR